MIDQIVSVECEQAVSITLDRESYEKTDLILTVDQYIWHEKQGRVRVM